MDSIYWRDESTNKIRCLGDNCELALKDVDCPDTCPIWAGTIARSLIAIKEYEHAIKEYRKAIEVAPDFKDAWVNTGMCYGQLKRYEEAITAYYEAYKLDNNYKNAIYGLASANKDAGKYEESLKWVEFYNHKFRDNALVSVELFCKEKM